MPLPLPPSSLVSVDDSRRAPPGAGVLLAVLTSLLAWAVVIVYLFWH
ncbi:MAG: hypothetical protein J7500_10945 [Sphingomonas sp.]|nr:hypothetical protein [Sphingomonas sp.]MBO9623217.1 hypothetical protein [Sphingomonas sp.]